MTEKDKYSALRWYLPPHFKDSLAKCRFEQGAIIYKDKPVGETWNEKIKHIDFLIQIQSPSRTTTTTSGGDVQKSNWDSEVVLELFYPNTKKKEIITTTQGRLFTFLWKDNIEVLYGNEPLLPPLFNARKSLLDIDENFINNKLPENSVGFAFFYNPTSDILIDKLNNIKNATSEYELEELTFSIEKSCEKLENENGIYPLLSTKLLLFKNAKYDDIFELIKNAVYKGTQDRFSINTHGLLIRK